MKRAKEKLFVVRKYVPATSAAAAIRKEKKVGVHDVYIDEQWEAKHNVDTYAIGFDADEPEDNYEGEW